MKRIANAPRLITSGTESPSEARIQEGKHAYEPKKRNFNPNGCHTGYITRLYELWRV